MQSNLFTGIHLCCLASVCIVALESLSHVMLLMWWCQRQGAWCEEEPSLIGVFTKWPKILHRAPLHLQFLFCSTFLYPCMCAFCFVFKSDFLHMLPTVWPVIISTQAMPQLFQVILDKSSAFRSTEDAMLVHLSHMILQSSLQITALQIYRCTIHLQHVILGRCFNNTVSKQPLVHG